MVLAWLGHKGKARNKEKGQGFPQPATWNVSGASPTEALFFPPNAEPLPSPLSHSASPVPHAVEKPVTKLTLPLPQGSCSRAHPELEPVRSLSPSQSLANDLAIRTPPTGFCTAP